MIWKDRELKTYADFMDFGIDACDSKAEAREFIKEYVKESIHARANIGYLIGYYSQEKQKRLYDWFDVVHPIYGTEHWTAEELFELGATMASRPKKENPWIVGAFSEKQ
jgi:TolA-binding protein